MRERDNLSTQDLLASVKEKSNSEEWEWVIVVLAIGTCVSTGLPGNIWTVPWALATEDVVAVGESTFHCHEEGYLGLQSKLQPVAGVISSEESLRILRALVAYGRLAQCQPLPRNRSHTRVLRTRLISLFRRRLATLHVMVPYTLSKFEQCVGRLEFEARMSG